MHKYTGKNVNLIGGNFNEILWFFDYPGDKPIPQHYLMPHKDGAGIKEVFGDHKARLVSYCRVIKDQLHDLVELLHERFRDGESASEVCDAWRQQAQEMINDIEKHLELLQNYKKNLQYDVLVGDNDCTFLTNIISFVKENKPVYPNMKFTIVVNGATQYKKLVNDAFSSENCKNAFANLYNFITKDPRYTVVQDAKQQVLDYLSVTGSPEYADCIEVVDILQIILCDLGPNIIFADQDYAPEDVARALDECADLMKNGMKPNDPRMYLNRRVFNKLGIEKQLAINIVHNYMIFYCKEHEFSQDNKAHLFDLVASFLSALRGAVVPNADFYCHNALECYKDENYIPKDDRIACVLDARSMLFSAKRLLANSMALTDYFNGGKGVTLPCSYLRIMVMHAINSGEIREYQSNFHGVSVFSLFLQNATFNKKREMRKEMLAIQCDALGQEKFPRLSPMLLFVHEPASQRMFKLPVYEGVHSDFSFPMNEELSVKMRQNILSTRYCYSQHCRAWERFAQERGYLLSSSIRDEFEICFDDMRKVSSFANVVHSYQGFLAKRGLPSPVNSVGVFLRERTSQDPVVEVLNTASDVQVLFLWEMVYKEIEKFLPLLSVLTSLEMAQERMQALERGQPSPDIDEFFPRLADRIIALYASDVRYKTGGDNQGLSDVFILSKMFINSFVLGGLVKNDMQAPACIADVPFMNALVTRGSIVHRFDALGACDRGPIGNTVTTAINGLKMIRLRFAQYIDVDVSSLSKVLASENCLDFYRHYVTICVQYRSIARALSGITPTPKPCPNVISAFMEMAIELPSQIMDIANFSKTCSIPCMMGVDKYLRRVAALQRFFVDSTIEEHLSKYPCTKVEELSGVDNIEELKTLNMRMIDGALCDDVSLTLRATSMLGGISSRSGVISLSLKEEQDVKTLLGDLSDCIDNFNADCANAKSVQYCNLDLY